MEKQQLFLNLMNSNCSISNENTLQHMINFRIYKYQWSLQLAEYLPRRERWDNLHFLRAKWEMFRVYGKTYLFQLTYTITWYMSLVTWQCYNNLVTRNQEVSLNSFPMVGTLGPRWHKKVKVSVSVFAKGFQLRSIMNKKVKLRSATKKPPHYSQYFYIKIMLILFFIFLPNLTSTVEEEEITNYNYLPIFA